MFSLLIDRCFCLSVGLGVNFTATTQFGFVNPNPSPTSYPFSRLLLAQIAIHSLFLSSLLCLNHFFSSSEAGNFPRKISDLSYDVLAVVTFTLLTLWMIKLNDLYQEYFFHADKSGKNSSCFCMKKIKAFGLTLCICLCRINAVHKVRKKIV